MNIRVRGKEKREWLYGYFLAISFIFLIVLHSLEYYPRFYKQNTSFSWFLRLGFYTGTMKKLAWLIASYNDFHNILRLFDVLRNFSSTTSEIPFTTSETVSD